MKCFACDYERFNAEDKLNCVGDDEFSYSMLTRRFINDSKSTSQIMYSCPKCKTMRL